MSPTPPPEPKAPNLITAAQLAKLTGFTERELRGLALAGFLPKSSGGSYLLDEAIPGCFKAYRQKLTESIPGAFESMQSASAATGIPLTVLKSAKRDASGAWRGSRIQTLPLIKWIFAQDTDGNEDWGERLKRASALREEIRLEKDKDKALDKDEVAFAVNKTVSLFFSLLDRRSNLELPPNLKGLDEAAIQKRLLASDEGLKAALRTGLAELKKK